MKNFRLVHLACTKIAVNRMAVSLTLFKVSQNSAHFVGEPGIEWENNSRKKKGAFVHISNCVSWMRIYYFFNQPWLWLALWTTAGVSLVHRRDLKLICASFGGIIFRELIRRFIFPGDRLPCLAARYRWHKGGDIKSMIRSSVTSYLTIINSRMAYNLTASPGMKEGKKS